MRLHDRLKQHTSVSRNAKTLDQLLSGANAADARREIAAAKDAGVATLSFRDIGDAPPATRRHAIAA